MPGCHPLLLRQGLTAQLRGQQQGAVTPLLPSPPGLGPSRQLQKLPFAAVPSTESVFLYKGPFIEKEKNPLLVSPLRIEK